MVPLSQDRESEWFDTSIRTASTWRLRDTEQIVPSDAYRISAKQQRTTNQPGPIHCYGRNTPS